MEYLIAFLVNVSIDESSVDTDQTAPIGSGLTLLKRFQKHFN